MTDADRTAVSSVVATGGRTGFLAIALRHWSRQTWPAERRELIVVDDTPGDDGARVCDGVPGVRYLHVAPMLLGDKLNVGCAEARFDVLHKWDDDDVYAPTFLTTAMAELAQCPSDAGLVVWDCYLLWLAWNGEVRFTGHGHKAGPSLTFDRALWEAAPFRSVPRSVDSHFLADHPDWRPVCGHADELVLVRHKANTWMQFWQTDVDAYIENELALDGRTIADFVAPEDLGFYEELGRRVTTAE